MASPPKLTGETLIVHHIPLVHCQVPDRQCCSASKRTNPFCQPDLGLARPGPAPERDFLQADSLLYSSLLQAASTDLAPVKAAGHTEGQPRELTARRQNPFLQSGGGPPEPGPEDLGQRSFRLHGGRASLPPRERALPPFRLHDADPTGKPWSAASRFDVVEGREETRAGDEPRKGSGPECMELDEYGGPPGSLSSCSFEHEWAADPDELLLPDLEAGRSRTCSCSSSEPPRCRCCSLSSPSEPPDQQMGCLSDSSCNSSDGVLVNFSALYDKASGRARPCPAPGSLSCNSSSGSRSDSAAFYLDLHASPEEPGTSCESSPRGGGPGRACGCHRPPSPLLDANCNSYPALCEPGASEGSDLSACLQSKARLVVATQNYYKLVTCDLSSQSSPSPAGSSVASGSEERLRGSPLQPTEYYLFGRPGGPPEESDSEGSREGPQGPATDEALEGQVYVNVPPPAAAAGRQRSRSYDRGLERSPAGRLGTLERLLSCPVKLSQPELIPDAPPPKRVTSFAELAKGRKRNGSSPPLPAGRDPSLEYTAIPEYQDSPVFREEPPRSSQSLPPMPLARSLHRSCESYRRPEWGHSASRQNGGPREVPPCGPAAFEQPFFSAPAEAGASSASSHGQKDARARADGGAPDSPAVVRYSKDQRPTTLPIQPFVFQHHFPRAAKARALHGPLASSLAQLYSLSAAARRPAGPPPSSASQSSASSTSADQPLVGGAPGHGQRSGDGAASLADGGARKPLPETTRPSPLGSYSPVRSHVPSFHGVDSSSRSPTPGGHPPRSQSCPISAGLLPTGRPSPAAAGTVSHAPHQKESPTPGSEEEGTALPEPVKLRATCVPPGGTLLPLLSAGLGLAGTGGPVEPLWKAGGSEGAGLSSVGGLLTRPLNGQPAKHPQLSYSDFFPDYFSLAEKPPAEFCLSPDGSAESVSVDLGQKKGLVKAINMAVDLIVAHFGTSRDPGVKAKLGNSSVSPNVGHLILKYLCPAVSSVLGDGLKAHVLDVIVGQRRNLPWSVVEASTQLGPSTKVLHSLCSRVSQCGELSSHAMRFNAFIFGLLNLRSLEFWFNHLYSHEDVIQAHYQPTGFLALAHGLCQGLFEEVLLLLQPLALLPFSLDLLFEHRLLQTGRTQRQQKELLCAQQGLVLSAHSTLQLMRAHGGGRPGSADGWAAAEQDAGPEGCRGSLGKEADAGADVGTGPGAPCSGRERRRARDGPAEPKKDRQASWWYQLMQSSQVYIEGAAEGAPRIRYERRKKALVEGAGRQGEPRRAPPPREGVVEGAEACPITEAALKGRAPPEEEPSRMQPSSAGEAAQEKGRPRWMGSPPDSVLTELKRVKEAEAESGLAPRPGSPEQHSAHGPGSGPPKWGHLFGSRKVPKEPRQASRLPSGWLNLDRSVFQLVAQTVGAGAWREAALEPRRQPAELSPPRSEGAGTWLDRSTPPEVPCGVKALCHHIATEAGQLSFRKGDVLRVLGKADADWLRCSRGAETGLVPIMYVTHVEDEDY
ncbi:iporin isoform X2 [Varanus komodoensis]|uniref:iporin isoform X2 n=1 Tax=Varanus komodoensis TaxID=61221 RepID=UPI001CF7B1F5|nr:iporin isoform X2 [Varanus komodoensis]